MRGRGSTFSLVPYLFLAGLRSNRPCLSVVLVYQSRLKELNYISRLAVEGIKSEESCPVYRHTSRWLRVGNRSRRLQPSCVSSAARHVAAGQNWYQPVSVRDHTKQYLQLRDTSPAGSPGPYFFLLCLALFSRVSLCLHPFYNYYEGRGDHRLRCPCRGLDGQYGLHEGAPAVIHGLK